MDFPHVAPALPVRGSLSAVVFLVDGPGGRPAATEAEDEEAQEVSRVSHGQLRRVFHMEQPALFPIAQREPDICKNRHQGAETSVEADKKVQKSKDRELIYSYIKMAGRFGHTLDELSIMLHRTPNAISGRLTELRVKGRIVTSDQTRLTRTNSKARVYIAA
jgi:hypothetical protein